MYKAIGKPAGKPVCNKGKKATGKPMMTKGKGRKMGGCKSCKGRK